MKQRLGWTNVFFPALESRLGEGREGLEVLCVRVEAFGALARSVDGWRDSLASTPANTKIPKVKSQGPDLFSLLRERDQTLGDKNGIPGPSENFVSANLLQKGCSPLHLNVD